MSGLLESTIEILNRLVSFETISGRPNHALVHFVEDYLSRHGIEPVLSFDETGEQANILATIGPDVPGGVMLNGHTDVVPVEGQNWASPPFKLTRKNDRLYGRGAVDMKGFLACVLASVPVFQKAGLKTPIHITFSYDEEIGGLGMPGLLDSMTEKTIQPDVVLVGEPTQMKIVTGHKGGYEMRTEVTGHAVHSCDPSKGVNAISIAAKLIAKIEEFALAKQMKPLAGSSFDPPYSTFNVGIIEGGIARNATAGWCSFIWEYRPLPGEDGAKTIAAIKNYAEQNLLPDMKRVHSDCDIRFITDVIVPALDDRNAAKALEFVGTLTGINDHGSVSFGTDGGYFSDVGLSTVVFGAGDIGRAHKADEFITIQELEQNLAFLQKIAIHLAN